MCLDFSYCHQQSWNNSYTIEIAVKDKIQDIGGSYSTKASVLLLLLLVQVATHSAEDPQSQLGP